MSRGIDLSFDLSVSLHLVCAHALNGDPLPSTGFQRNVIDQAVKAFFSIVLCIENGVSPITVDTVVQNWISLQNAIILLLWCLKQLLCQVMSEQRREGR